MFGTKPVSAPVEPPLEAAAVERRSWLQELNPEQLAAATHPGGPLLILAGAGTGKTTTLCARVAWLIDQGAAPERIMLLTFTRRTARELIQRTRAMVALPRGGGVIAGTFHSVAHRFVRMHAAALGLAPDFSVLDPGDAADLLDLIREEHGHAQSAQRFPRKSTLLDIYSRTVNAQRTLSEVVAESFPWCEEHVPAIAGLLKAYTARKRALSGDEVLGPVLERGVEHLLIDEYQDVNGLQVDIVRGLRRRCREVTVVGDDMQAIYGWRSASAEHILGFSEVFEDTSVVTLERNYRAAQPLLDTANALAVQAIRAYPKQLRTDRLDGARPGLIFCRDEPAQAQEVCERVMAARERGMLLREQAVLMRASHDSDLLELELTRRRIPFVKYGGLKYLESAHVKDLVALFRLVDNPGNELSWFRLLQLLEGVGPATARRALNQLLAAAPEPLAAWPQACELLPSSARAAADAVVAALRAARGQRLAGAQAEGLRDALAPLIRNRYPSAPARLADLDQLVAAARQAPDLAHFVAELALDPPQSSSDLAGPPHLDEDYLVLSTIHSAKGLEWQGVHVLAIYDGNFPACMSAGSTESIDEERRLLYVAMTRARRELHLYVPERYYHRPKGRDDAHGYGQPSRFLTDAVRETCQVTRLDDALAAPAPAGGPRRITVSVDALLR